MPCPYSETTDESPTVDFDASLTMKDRIEKALNLIDRAVEWLITAAFALMVLVGGIQVFSRYALRNSLSWSEEFQKFMHIWLIFLAIPLAYKHDAHIGMRVIFDRLPAGFRRTALIAIDCLWFALGCVMVAYTTRIMNVAKTQTSPGLGLRMDIVYACIVIGGAYLCLMAARKVYGRASGLVSGGNAHEK